MSLSNLSRFKNQKCIELHTCVQAVYAMPTQGDAAQGSIPLALQTLFYKVRPQMP